MSPLETIAFTGLVTGLFWIVANIYVFVYLLEMYLICFCSCFQLPLCTTMAMLKIHKKALDKTLKVFTEDLDIWGTLVHLQSNGIFEQHDVDFIRVEKPGTQVMELIKRIKQKGHNAYQVFREFLLQGEGSRHIAEVLDKHLSEVTVKF